MEGIWNDGHGRRGAVVKRAEHISTIVLVNIWVAQVRVPGGSVGRDLNLQKLNYQCLTKKKWWKLFQNVETKKVGMKPENLGMKPENLGMKPENLGENQNPWIQKTSGWKSKISGWKQKTTA